jgi:MFS family permease
MLGIRPRLESLTADLPPTYWLLWLGTVINRLGGFVIPFLSLYLTSERGISVAQAGLVVSLFGAGAFAAHLAGGELADRLGRRPVLLLSLLGTPPLMAALGFARHLVMIGILTALVGFFTELYRPAVSAAIADLVAPSARTRAYGYMYWAINVGAALAPIAAGFLAHLDYVLLFIGDAITTLIYGLIVLWRIRETQPADAQRAAQAPIGSRVRQLASEPILLVMTGLTLIFGVVYMQGFVTLPLDMQNHGLGPSDYGLAAAANGILVVLITIQISRAVAKWPHFGVLALAALLTGAGFGMNAWASTLPAYILAVGVWTLGEILVNAVAPTIIAELSPVQLRGLYQGVFGSAWGLAFFVGPLLGGWVFGAFSPDALWLSCAVLGGVVAAGFLALSGAARRRLARDNEGSATA